jgi:hypothetical protein
MLQTTAAAGGAAALGTGAVPDQIDPVGESEAIAPLVAGALVGGGIIAGAAGTVAYAKLTGGDGDVEEIKDSLVYNRSHDIASTMQGQREGELRQSIRQDWIEPDPDTTPFAKTAWSEIDGAAGFEIVNGNNAEAQTAAFQALDRQFTIAYWNAIQGHNRALIGGEDTPGLMTAMANAVDGGETTGDSGTTIGRDLGNFSVSGTHLQYSTAYMNDIIAVDPDQLRNPHDWEPVEASRYTWTDDNDEEQDPGYYTLFKRTWQNAPVPPSEIEEIPVDEVTLYGIPCMGSYNNDKASMAKLWSSHIDTATDGANRSVDVSVTHPERESVEPLQQTLYSRYLQAIDDGYSTISDQVTTYVDSLDDALAEGVIDPADIYSPSDAIDQFAGTSQQSQFAAQMTFNGIGAPSTDHTYEARIKHDDLASDDHWGQLFVSFASGTENVELTPGRIITPDEYRGAYFGFVRQDNQDFTRRVLSDDSDLEILDIRGTTGEQEYESDATAKEGGEVTVYQGEDPPEPIQFPAENDGYSIVVQGAVNKSTHPVTEVKGESTENGQRYYLPSTNIPEGESIEQIRLIQPVNLEEATPYVSDPGNISQDAIVERLESRAELIQQIEELNDGPLGGGGGLFDGGLFDGGLPTLPGLGVLESAVVVGGGSILTLLGLSAASG